MQKTYSGSKTFEKRWLDVYKWVQPDKNSQFDAYCTICKASLTIRYTGIGALDNHNITDKHIRNMRKAQSEDSKCDSPIQIYSNPPDMDESSLPYVSELLISDTTVVGSENQQLQSYLEGGDQVDASPRYEPPVIPPPPPTVDYGVDLASTSVEKGIIICDVRSISDQFQSSSAAVPLISQKQLSEFNGTAEEQRENKSPSLSGDGELTPVSPTLETVEAVYSNQSSDENASQQDDSNASTVLRIDHCSVEEDDPGNAVTHSGKRRKIKTNHFQSATVEDNSTNPPKVPRLVLRTKGKTNADRNGPKLVPQPEELLKTALHVKRKYDTATQVYQMATQAYQMATQAYQMATQVYELAMQTYKKQCSKVAKGLEHAFAKSSGGQSQIGMSNRNYVFLIPFLQNSMSHANTVELLLAMLTAKIAKKKKNPFIRAKRKNVKQTRRC